MRTISQRSAGLASASAHRELISRDVVIAFVWIWSREKGELGRGPVRLQTRDHRDGSNATPWILFLLPNEPRGPCAMRPDHYKFIFNRIPSAVIVVRCATVGWLQRDPIGQVFLRSRPLPGPRPSTTIGRIHPESVDVQRYYSWPCSLMLDPLAFRPRRRSLDLSWISAEAMPVVPCQEVIINSSSLTFPLSAPDPCALLF